MIVKYDSLALKPVAITDYGPWSHQGMLKIQKTDHHYNIIFRGKKFDLVKFYYFKIKLFNYLKKITDKR